MNNLELYDKVREVPKEAQKPIQAGRLKGKTDINPMWRIKALTENFGMIGIGWYYNITKQWLENGSNGEISAFVNIELFVKVDGEWSKPIIGTGGSSFVTKEKNGLYVSDECFKMALTDAISVSCKALGFGANIYWSSDNTKYNKLAEQPKANSVQIAKLYEIGLTKGYNKTKVDSWVMSSKKKLVEELTTPEIKAAIEFLSKAKDKKVEQDTADLFNTEQIPGT